MKMSEHWSDMNMWQCTDYKMGLIRRISRKAVLQMKLMCSFIKRSLSTLKPRFLTESEKEMVAWQFERGAGGCLSFEELKRIVSVLFVFSWSLLTLILSFTSDMQVWRAFLVSSSCSGLHDLRS